MADNVQLSAGTADGAVLATDDVTGVHYPITKLAHGALDSATLVSTVSGLPVQGTVTANLSATDNAVLDQIELNTDPLLVVGGGAEATAIRVTIANDSTGVLSVDDGGGALTVDGTVTANLSATDNAVLDTIELNTDSLAVVGGGVEATALRVTLANDSTGVLSVDDGGGVLTVDGTVTVQDGAGSLTVDHAALDLLHAADFDTGAGTDNTPAIGLVTPASGGAAVVPGGGGVEATALRVTIASDSTGVLSVDDNGGSLTVDGTVTANLSATDNAVLDQIELNTDALLVIGGGVEATALRVTIANDSTGVLSVDDGGGALTVDGTVTANLSATDNAVLDAIQAAVETIDNAISGTEMQVDVVAALPAGTNLIGVAAAGLSTSAIYNGTTALTPKFAVIDVASSGDNTLVAAVADRKIRVLSVFLVAAAAVTARFESGASGTALTGQMSLAANGGFVLPFNPTGWFETGSNTLLNLELSAAQSVDGSLVYVEVA